MCAYDQAGPKLLRLLFGSAAGEVGFGQQVLQLASAYNAMTTRRRSLPCVPSSGPFPRVACLKSLMMMVAIVCVGCCPLLRAVRTTTTMPCACTATAHQTEWARASRGALDGHASRRRDCHFADTPLSVPVGTPTTGEGVAAQ